tara:strand:- start:857 stop:1189 length:333 start_codon:yes stop_codon:yes gene_type:complete
MSSPFDKREKAAEAKYVHDADMAFKVNARRNKLLGLWAAELIGLSSKEAEAFAKQTVLSDFEEPGQEDVFKKVMSDLQKADIDVTESQVRQKMEELISIANEQIQAEIKG